MAFSVFTFVLKGKTLQQFYGCSSIPVFIFAGQAAYTIHQGRPISGSVLGAMALLALILILFVIYKHDGTIFNKTTLSIMIYTLLGTCLYLGILVLFSNF